MYVSLLFHEIDVIFTKIVNYRTSFKVAWPSPSPNYNCWSDKRRVEMPNEIKNIGVLPNSHGSKVWRMAAEKRERDREKGSKAQYAWQVPRFSRCFPLFHNWSGQVTPSVTLECVTWDRGIGRAWIAWTEEKEPRDTVIPPSLASLNFIDL